MAEILATNTILDKIVAKKIGEVEKLKSLPRLKPIDMPLTTDPARDFIQALTDPEKPGRAIIAEIKRASPSEGVIREPFRPAEIAADYETNGARAISVLTDLEFFQGSIGVLQEVRKTVGLPLLRKDFIIDSIQVEEAARAGADAVLLIARILDDELLNQLYQRAASLNLAALIEVHDQNDLERTLALSPQPTLIGINNRDLADFSVSIERTKKLLPLIPKNVTIISESGLHDSDSLNDLANAGAHAFLIGTALMKAQDIGRALRSFIYE